MPNKKPLIQNNTQIQQASDLNKASIDQNLMRKAISLQTSAASYGFDWPDIAPVFDKLNEEIHELKYEVEQSKSPSVDVLENKKRLEDELGDVLFCCMNLARFLDLDPEKALQSTNKKFEQRFSFIESYVSQQGKKMQDLSLNELDKVWDLAKKQGL